MVFGLDLYYGERFRMVFVVVSRCIFSSKIGNYLRTYSEAKKKFSNSEEAIASIERYAQRIINSDVKAELK